MIADQREVEQLAGALNRLGVDLPEPLGDLLDAFDVVNETRVPDPAAALARRIQAGEVEVADLGAELEAAITIAARGGAAHDARNLITDSLCRRFSSLLAGAAGDALLDAVRPRYEAARAAMETAEFGPGTDPGQVILAGDEAVAQWRALPAAEDTLSALWDGLIRPMVTTFGVLPASPHWLGGHLPLLLLASSADHARQLAPALMNQHTPHGPGGRWHGVGLGPLNTLDQARALLADIERRAVGEVA